MSKENKKPGKKGKKLSDDEIAEMWYMSDVCGYDNDTIAAKFGVHTNTVSRKISEMRKMKEAMSLAITKREAPSAGGELGLTLPRENPLFALNEFNDIAKYVNASGVVAGAGLHAIYEGFARDDLTHDEKMTRAMKGGAVVVGHLLSMLDGFKAMSEESEQRMGNMRSASDEYDEDDE